jgi:hypothetical protein
MTHANKRTDELTDVYYKACRRLSQITRKRIENPGPKLIFCFIFIENNLNALRTSVRVPDIFFDFN